MRPTFRELSAALHATIAVAAALALSACTTSAPGPEDTAAPTLTPPALVAAVEQHLGRPVQLAAPLFSSDLDPDHPDRVAAGTVAVEVAWDEPVGDNSHVRVIVTPSTATAPAAQIYAARGCDALAGLTGCEEGRSQGGTRTRLAWSAHVPEEDPGVIEALALHSDYLVSARYVGQPVPQHLGSSDPDAADLDAVAQGLIALVSDPDVAPTTSDALDAAGREIPEAVMLDWYGQGNGSPPPPEYLAAHPDPDDDQGAADPDAARTTPRALAAAAIAHLGDDVISANAAPPAPGEASHPVAATLVYDRDGTEVTYRVSVTGEEAAVAEAYRCPEPLDEVGCDLIEDGTHEVMVTWYDTVSGSVPGHVELITVRDGERIAASMSGVEVAGDPRDGPAASQTATLFEFLTDPTVGLRTSTQRAAAGRALSGEIWNARGPGR